MSEPKRDRAGLGFGDELDDLSAAVWATPKPKSIKAAPNVARSIAEASGFPSREPVKPVSIPATQQRRRRTGRNAQFNIKARPETIEAFTRIADANGWGLGEAFEKATELLEQANATR